MAEVEAMGNNWMIDWLERRGEEKGRTDEARRVIERRFGEAAPDLRARVEGLEDLPRLEQFLDEAVTCASLAELREILARP